MRRPRRPLLAALASAPATRAHTRVTFVSPARRIPPASCRTRTDRQAPLMRFRLLPFGVRWSRRTARSYRLRAIPLRRCSQPRHPRQEVGSPVRFLAPRVSVAFQLRALETPPARVIRGRFLSADVPGPRRTVLATWPGPSKSRRRPWDSLTALRSFASDRG